MIRWLAVVAGLMIATGATAQDKADYYQFAGPCLEGLKPCLVVVPRPKMPVTRDTGAMFAAKVRGDPKTPINQLDHFYACLERGRAARIKNELMCDLNTPYKVGYSPCPKSAPLDWAKWPAGSPHFADKSLCRK